MYRLMRMSVPFPHRESYRLSDTHAAFYNYTGVLYYAHLVFHRWLVIKQSHIIHVLCVRIIITCMIIAHNMYSYIMHTHYHIWLYSQLECCGIDNYTDWITYNREAVVENGFFPPGNCQCNPNVEDSDDCVRFEFPNSTNFVWKDVSIIHTTW